MKILERLALILFSIIILILAVFSCLVVFDFIELDKIANYINGVIENTTVARTILVVAGVCILLAIKSLFFPSKINKKEEIKSGILLENKDGRLLISKDTIENLVNSVANSFKEAIEVQSKVILDAENNITVFLSLLVDKNAVIKELTANIQTKIKDTIKRNTDLEVNQININVKNIDDNGIKENANNVKVVNAKENEKINQAKVINESNNVKENENIKNNNEVNNLGNNNKENENN